ncbi:MAG: peptidylprolyl isomerase [Candidatus Micrarchaeota archaeon]|nr:peptidylprolyl isomerase [Candidatus Micrarchaeota archaeon]
MQLDKITAKPLYPILIIVVAAAIIGSAYFVLSGAATPAVAAGDNVSVYYTGKFTNGTVFDTNVGKQPLQFTAGSNQLIEGFDQGVIGMKLNETKTITLPPSQAYGEVNPSLIVQVPLSSFGNQTVSVGMVVTTSSYQQGTITAVNATTATVDFNPPLAGDTLVFTIKVVGIKKKG